MKKKEKRREGQSTVDSQEFRVEEQSRVEMAAGVV
jgi:hypothetical protein